MTDIDKYNLTIWVYKNCLRGFTGQRWHKHHIKPKSIYPELRDDPDNIVAVPDIVHWALHEWLNKHLKDSANGAYERLKFADVATFINSQSHYQIDFSKHDEILEFIFTEVQKLAVDYKNAQTEFLTATAHLEELTRSSFFFSGSGFFFRNDIAIPDDLNSFISENCKQRADTNRYGFCLKTFSWNCDISLLIGKITNAGFSCFAASTDKIAAKNGYGHLLKYIKLHKPILHKPDRTMLCTMFFRVYERFRLCNIDEINITDSNIDSLLSNIEPEESELAKLVASL